LNTLTRLRQQLLTGLSYAIPFIACGGVLLAVAIALAPATPAGPDFQATAVVLTLHQLGTGAFTLMPPVLAGYIAYAIAGRPGLTPSPARVCRPAGLPDSPSRAGIVVLATIDTVPNLRQSTCVGTFHILGPQGDPTQRKRWR